jgi:hypothetical protein
MFEILTKENFKNVFEKLGRQLKQLHSERMYNQQGINGSRYPALKPATIEQKRKMGGGVEANAEKRMIRTGDFQKQAYEYEIKDNTFRFFISDKPHKRLKTKAKRQARVTNKKKGRNVSPEPPKMSNVTYRDIALYNLNGNFDLGHRSIYNPGANFFGLNDNEVNKYIDGAFKSIRTIAEKNIKTELQKIIANVKK